MSLCPLCKTNTEALSHGFEHFLIEAIQRSNPEWTEADGSCATCVDYYRRLVAANDSETDEN